MKPLLVTFAFLAVAAVGFLLYRIVFRKTETAFGFMDYVRNPALALALKDEFDMRDAEVTALAKRPSHRLVEMMLQDPDQFGTPTRAICEAGPRIVPALLAAISDPRFQRATAEGYVGGGPATDCRRVELSRRFIGTGGGASRAPAGD